MAGIGSKKLALIAALCVVAAVIGVAMVTTLADVRFNRAVIVHASTTSNATDTGETRALAQAAAGRRIEVSDVATAIAFVEARNDCADFRVTTLLRLLLAHEGALSPEARDGIVTALRGFRYWMDQPGADSMVFWSENHQVLFAAAEFLAGQRLADDVFSDGRTGRAHQSAARARIIFWLEQRWRHGFSEWNSHYYTEDIAALANLIDFAEDAELRAKATIVLDLLMYDLASQSVRGEFIATSGRLYENNRKTGDAGMRRILAHAFGHDRTSPATGLEINFLMSSYRAPPVLRAIAQDTGHAVIRASYGRDLSELDRDASLRASDHRIMALWGMQAFTNPEAIGPSLRTIRAHGLFANSFFAPFMRLNYRALSEIGALPWVSRGLDLPTNGTLLARANTYTLRTPDFAMSTAQAYRPGDWGNQQHVFGITFGQGVTLFHTHPAVRPGDRPPNGNAPGYWTGTDRLPLSCQDGAVNLSLYRLPARPGFGRAYTLDFTHLYAPRAQFDRLEEDGARLFLQKDHALVAVTAGGPLERTGADEYILRGPAQFWVTEASSTRDETFEAFVMRIRAATPRFDGETLAYETRAGAFTASFARGCAIGGAPLQVQYDRIDAPYARAHRDADEITFAFAGQSLTLDFETGRRMIGSLQGSH